MQNTRFEHSQGTMAYAYALVKEYDDHQKEQDRLQREARPGFYDKFKNTRNTRGGMKLEDPNKEVDD